MRQSTPKKLETIVVKMETVTPEISNPALRNDLVQIKSRMLELLRRAEHA